MHMFDIDIEGGIRFMEFGEHPEVGRSGLPRTHRGHPGIASAQRRDRRGAPGKSCELTKSSVRRGVIPAIRPYELRRADNKLNLRRLGLPSSYVDYEKASLRLKFNVFVSFQTHT